MIRLEQKINKPYAVTGFNKAVKDVDINKRVVTGMFNGYFFIDSELDMLIHGCAKKSIQERGAGSKAGNKIKHLKDHDWDKNVARIDVLNESTITYDGREITGIYHESYFPETTDSSDLLIKIQEGLYDARSIGFKYDKLMIAEKESEVDEHVKNWNQYYPLALNPEKADEAGYFWVVKEIQLWEGSDVSFGSNALTPFLGMKSEGDINGIALEIGKKLERIESLFKNGTLSDEGFRQLEMENAQLKTLMNTVTSELSSLKSTFIKPPIKDTQEEKDAEIKEKNTADKKKLLFKNLMKSYEI